MQFINKKWKCWQFWVKLNLYKIVALIYLIFDLFVIILQGALADIFLRGTNLVNDARGMASLVSTLFFDLFFLLYIVLLQETNARVTVII